MQASFSMVSRVWASETFGHCQLGNTLRTRRLVDYAARQAARPSASTHAACSGNEAAAEGAYRFLENDAIDPDAIALGGFRSTVKKWDRSKKVLIITDTTGQTFSHSVAQELEGYNDDDDKNGGWKVHSSLMVDAESGMPLGLIDQQWWQRDPAGPGKATRKKRKYEEKESFKWQDSAERIRELVGDMANTVQVSDRESDVYEYLADKIGHGEGFVVRASHNRRLKSGRFLWDEMDDKPLAYQAKLEIPQRKGRKKRTALVDVRYGKITLSKKGLAPIEVTAIWVLESDPPKGAEPVEWMLLTSETVEDNATAEMVIGWYRKRWLIEDFHRTWKSICAAKERRLQHAGNLQRLLVILAFIAVRMMQLRALADAHPDSPCTEVLTEPEWECLYRVENETNPLPKQPLTMAWALTAIAKLGGWTDTKRTGRKGLETLSRGFVIFQDLVRGYELALRVAKR